MSWSFLIRNGDLAQDGPGYAKATAGTKLGQDLRCALLTRRSSNPDEPSFGSILNGGVAADGTALTPLTGSSDWDRVALLVESEIRRVGREYQSYQADRTRNDQAVYGTTTLTDDEVLASIDSIDFVSVEDNLLVNVTISSLAGRQQALTLPVG